MKPPVRVPTIMLTLSGKAGEWMSLGSGRITLYGMQISEEQGVPYHYHNRRGIHRVLLIDPPGCP